MERLSFIDQVMHKIEGPGLPALNMQGAMLVDPGKSPYKITPKIIAEHIAARLADTPLLQKKLVQDRLKIGDLRMVDDPSYDPTEHISFATLPSPGDQETLFRHMAKFSIDPLEDNRPLWRFEIIDGLHDGKIAIIQKLSHATMDGMAALQVMQKLFDPKPTEPSQYNPGDWVFDTEPSDYELLREALKENLQRYGVKTPKTLYGLTKLLAKSARNKLLSNPDKKTAKASSTKKVKAQSTSLNGAISADKRSLSFTTFELGKLKTLSKSLDCKLNDLCLLMASEAMVNYLKGTGENINFDLFLLMPMSTRASHDKSGGNALALSAINTHNTLGSFKERLDAIKKDTQTAKTSRTISGSDGNNIPDVTDMLSPLLIDVLALALQKTQPWNLITSPANAVMSNVPGPSWPLYFAGMPIEYQIPIIPVFHKAALSIGATSMGDTFSFGFHGCGEVVKQENMHLLNEGLHNAFNALSELTNEETPSKAKAKRKAPAKPKATKTTAKPKNQPKKPAATTNRASAPGIINGSDNEKPALDSMVAIKDNG